MPTSTMNPGPSAMKGKRTTVAPPKPTSSCQMSRTSSVRLPVRLQLKSETKSKETTIIILKKMAALTCNNNRPLSRIFCNYGWLDENLGSFSAKPEKHVNKHLRLIYKRAKWILRINFIRVKRTFSKLYSFLIKLSFSKSPNRLALSINNNASITNCTNEPKT
jgi:hypothetical protein